MRRIIESPCPWKIQECDLVYGLDSVPNPRQSSEIEDLRRFRQPRELRKGLHAASSHPQFEGLSQPLEKPDP